MRRSAGSGSGAADEPSAMPWRSIGIGAYGVSPFRLSEEDARTVHGHDERVTVENLQFGVEFMYRIVERVAR